MEEKRNIKEHKITLDNRAEGCLTGVTDVYAFDEECISLMTENGKLQIKGEQLHVKSWIWNMEKWNFAERFMGLII